MIYRILNAFILFFFLMGSSSSVFAKEEDVGTRKLFSMKAPYDLAKEVFKAGYTVTEKTVTTSAQMVQEIVEVPVYFSKKTYTLVEMGLQQHESGHHKKAIRAYKKALKTDKHNPYIYSLLSSAYLVEEKAKKAEKYAYKAIAGDPTFAEAYRLLGVIYETQGNLAKSEAAYDKYAQLHNIQEALTVAVEV